MFSNFKRLSFKHKNNKLWYYFHNYLRQYYPLSLFTNKLKSELKRIHDYDSDYIFKRVNYYNQLNELHTLSSGAKALSEIKLGKKQKTYYFDFFEFTRYFNSKLIDIKTFESSPMKLGFLSNFHCNVENDHLNNYNNYK